MKEIFLVLTWVGIIYNQTLLTVMNIAWIGLLILIILALFFRDSKLTLNDWRISRIKIIYSLLFYLCLFSTFIYAGFVIVPVLIIALTLVVITVLNEVAKK